MEAFLWDAAPTYLVRDNDGAYGQRSGTIVTTPILSGLHHRYAGRSLRERGAAGNRRDLSRQEPSYNRWHEHIVALAARHTLLTSALLLQVRPDTPKFVVQILAQSRLSKA